MDYNFTPICVFWETKLSFIWVSYPDYILFESNMVMCCPELSQRIAIPLFLVGQEGEEKLPLEVSALVGLSVWYVMSNAAVPLEQAVTLNTFLEWCFWHSLLNAYAIHVFK